MTWVLGVLIKRFFYNRRHAEYRTEESLRGDLWWYTGCHTKEDEDIRFVLYTFIMMVLYKFLISPPTFLDDTKSTLPNSTNESLPSYDGKQDDQTEGKGNL